MKRLISILLMSSLLMSCQSKETVEEFDQIKPVIKETDTVHNIDHLKAIPYKDLPDDQIITVDRRVLTNEMIYYGDHEVITSTDSKTALFDIKNDRLVWEKDIGGHSIEQTVNEGLYYVNSKEGLKAISIDTGTIKKTYDNDNANIPYSQFIFNDYIITSHLDMMTVYDKSSGDVLWDHPVDDIIINPVELEDAFFIKVDNHIITAFDKDTGNIVKTIDGMDDIYKQGFLLQDKVLIFNEDVYEAEPVYLDVYKQESLEHIQQIEMNRSGFKPMITNNELYVFNPLEAVIAIDGSLIEERWRLGDNHTTYNFTDMIADENGLHILVEDKNINNSTFYLHLDATDGSVIQYVKLDGTYERDITYNFYAHDEKVYIKLVHNGKNIYYILATDNVHKPF